MPAEQDQQAAHMDLADYFKTRELSARKIDELPYQLSRAKSWNRLYNILSDLPFFHAAWSTNQFEVKAYWVQVENNSQLQMVDAYRPVLRTPGEVTNTGFVWTVGMLLADTGHPEEALSLREYLVDHFRQSGDKGSLSYSLGNQALILYARGDLDGAMALHKEKERICKELGHKYGLSISLGNQGVILYFRGDLDGAMVLFKEQERLCRELGNKDGLALFLGDQANILYARGDLDGAMVLYKEQERLCKELGNKDGLSRSLINQANLLSEKMNRPREALPLAEEAYRLATDHGLTALAGQIKPILDAVRAKGNTLLKRYTFTNLP